MTKKYFFSPGVILPTYKYIKFQSKQNRKRDFEFFTTPYWLYQVRASEFSIILVGQTGGLGNMAKAKLGVLLNFLGIVATEIVVYSLNDFSQR